MFCCMCLNPDRDVKSPIVMPVQLVCMRSFGSTQIDLLLLIQFTYSALQVLQALKIQ